MTILKDSILLVGAAVAGLTVGDAIESHSVSLGTVGAVAGIILPAVWWLSRKFTSLDDRLAGLENKLGDLPCNKKDSCRL